MTISNGQNPSSDSTKRKELSEETEAAAVDAKFEEILRVARERVAAAPLESEKSIREGDEYMKKSWQNAKAACIAKIERKELIPRNEFRKLLGFNDEWIEDALADNRLFFSRARVKSDSFLPSLPTRTSRATRSNWLANPLKTCQVHRNSIFSQASRRFCEQRRLLMP
jgi:hypothetical protein